MHALAVKRAPSDEEVIETQLWEPAAVRSVHVAPLSVEV